MKFFADYGAARVSVGFGTKLRFQMAKSLSNANGAFFKGAATGQFANAFNVEASKSQGLFRYSVEIIFSIIHASILLASQFGFRYLWLGCSRLRSLSFCLFRCLSTG